jgi:hypothetical protein
LGSSLDYLVKGATDTPPVRRPLVIPAELAEAAEENHIPFPVAIDLVRWNDMVVARRSRGGEADQAGHTPSKEDWTAIFRAYRLLSGEDDDGATRS